MVIICEEREITFTEIKNRVDVYRHQMITDLKFNVAEVSDIEIKLGSDADAWCRRTSWRSKKCTIGVASWMLRAPRHFLADVLVHELCHAVRKKGAMSHGDVFKKIAEKVSRHFEGVYVTAYSSPALSEWKVENGIVPYVVRCKKCGQVLEYYRKGKVVKYLLGESDEKFVCGKCKGKLKLDRKHSKLL